MNDENKNLLPTVPNVASIIKDDEKLGNEITKFLDTQAGEASYWNSLFNDLETPESQRHYRKGPKDRATGEHVMLEYVKDSYTIRMLNALFPGWYPDDMTFQYIPEVQTFVVTGYAVVRYAVKDGVKTRRMYAVGACQVHGKVDDPSKASGAEDMAKGAYTEWIKLVGKRLGIGVDVYEQSITKKMMDAFEDRISTYPENSLILSIVKNISDKTAFLEYVGNIPTKEQGTEFQEILKKCPPHTHEGLKVNFQKNTQMSIPDFFKMIEVNLEKIKQGASNGTK
jgi:hypothetical protein